MMLLIGMTLALPGEVISDPLNLMTKSGLVSEDTLTFFFTSVGMLRMAALYANGAIPTIGPKLRAFGSILGGLIWFELLTASIYVGIVSGKTTIAGAIYVSLTIGEIFSCYRATFDAGRRT